MKGFFPVKYAGRPASGSESEEPMLTPALAAKVSTKQKRKAALAVSKELYIIYEL